MTKAETTKSCAIYVQNDGNGAIIRQEHDKIFFAPEDAPAVARAILAACGEDADGWTPVERGFPEPNETVEVTTVDGGGVQIVERAFWIKGKWYLLRNGSATVLAWRPLPTPYKAKGTT